MKIAEHNISFQTSHSLREEYSRQETLTFATRDRRQVIQNSIDARGQSSSSSRIEHIEPDRVEISAEGKKSSAADEVEDSEYDLTPKQKMELEIIKKMLGRLFDGDFKWLDPKKFIKRLKEAQKEGEKNEKEIEEAQKEDSSDEGADFAIAYDYHERHFEAEKLSFEAEGTIKTADGKEINFNTNLNIERSFLQETSVSLRAGNAKLIDPLVVNYEGKAAELSERNFEFDLNSDGIKNTLATLKPGSGFLAHDRNNNGKIDDGGELFGPESGHGFKELARHDNDKNRFIDAGDEIYEQLKLMTFDSEGETSLLSLEEAGVGAIFLGSAETDFSYKTLATNELQGQLSRTGVFISPDGQTGTVQQIDLAARE
ncbi:MAG: hypothetical protein ACLFN5_07565 [bacterium]